MRRTFVTLLTSVGLLQLWLPLEGCSSSHQINYSWINEAGGSHPTTITFLDAHRVQTETMHMRADSIRWVEPKTMRAFSAPTSSVRTIEWREHGRGSTEGMGNGILIGLGASLPIAILMARNEHGDFAGFGEAIGVVVVSLLSMLIGGIAGGISGHLITVELH